MRSVTAWTTTATTRSTRGPTWYLDFDSDGFGGSSFTHEGCEPLEGYVATADDCDDASALVFPGAAEICDELDNDCNGVTDEDVTSTYYLDSDGDGVGDAGFTVAACSLPAGYADNALDCMTSPPPESGRTGSL